MDRVEGLLKLKLTPHLATLVCDYRAQVKCVACGVYGGPGSFLRFSFFSLIDVLVMTSYIIEISLPDHLKHEYSLRYS